MKNYDVIIVGGGPVGVALGIELGMKNVKTLIVEKHKQPLVLPRAQLINPRSMEFFRRWGISQQLKDRKLLKDDYPLRSIWCSGMTGEVYSSVDLSENVNQTQSPENYHRVPQWITEAVLRERLNDFSCVTWIKNYEVSHVEQTTEQCMVTVKNRDTNVAELFSSSYVVGCDGARSKVRQMAEIEMHAGLPPRRAINLMFKSTDLKNKMTVPKGFLYYNLTMSNPAALGCVDYDNGLWYSLITYPGDQALSEINLSDLLDEVAGCSFQKEITQANFWDIQAEIAMQYRVNRIFLAGDAAHILPPTGGHGLNTGLGDALNLAWKLAAVIHHRAEDSLLDSYEVERQAVAIRNVKAAGKNAQDAGSIRKKFPPETMPEAFAKENERIARQHAISPGIALGYCYSDSNDDYVDDPSHYSPTASPGFFAPHCYIEKDKSIYDYLSTDFNLLVTDELDKNELDILINKLDMGDKKLKIISLSGKEFKNIYKDKYYLIRPDWHIAWSSNGVLSKAVILSVAKDLLRYNEKDPSLRSG